jgi:pimeloyl-ACP methyl ester carboxylesterase
LPSNRFADNGSSRIAYELYGHIGRRAPWLVLIQGLGFDRSGWAPVISPLRRRFRLVLIDNRGSGRSTTPDRKFTVADMAADVAAVLDGSRIARAHVLGASLGGMVAQELAIGHPQRVDRLVLACTTPGWPYGYPMPRASVQQMTAAASLPVEAAQRSLVENALSPDTLKTHPELVERIVRNQKARPGDPAAWKALAGAGASYSGGTRQSLIRARTLIMYGDADAVVDPRNSKLLSGRVPSSQVVVFPGLGHLFFWEEPAQFAKAVTSFLLAPAEKSLNGSDEGSRRRAQS